MRTEHLGLDELDGALAQPGALDDLLDPTGSVVVVDLDDAPDGPGPADAAAPGPGLVPVVVVGLSAADDELDHPGAGRCDVVLPPAGGALDAVLAAVASNPLAATALVVLLRGAADRSTAEGLLAESTTYAMLQGGPEFARWRLSRPVRTDRVEHGPAVVVARTGDRLDLVLSRPGSRNALDARMRDELVEALAVAHADPSVHEVHLSGAGPSFCSGGDLDEFGSRPDPATAHLIRLARSVPWLLAGIAERVVAHLHGACMGSGIELPAFAARVEAVEGATFGLPEVGLGLVPGAGGTVSIPRRIGRHRTARLALTGERIDVATAVAWGLVDAVVDRGTTDVGT